HRYGFEIVDVTGYPTGTVYPALRRLEHAGYVQSRWEAERRAFSEARPPRRSTVCRFFDRCLRPAPPNEHPPRDRSHHPACVTHRSPVAARRLGTRVA